MSVLTRTALVTYLAAASWALSGGVARVSAQTAAPAAPGSGSQHILAEAVANARTTGNRLAGPAPRVVPGAAQYQDGLTKLQAGQYAEALAPLQAAARANPNNAVFHLDLAAAYAGIERLDDAALELVRARQIQGANQYFTVALAAVKALREQWNEASLNLEAAVSADSSLIDEDIAAAGVSWGWRARRMGQVVAWSQIATARFPQIAEPWYRLAVYYQQQRDTTRGVAAIQRFVALRPNDRAGQFLYAVFLFNLQRNDSALVLALQTLQDSALRESAAEILFGVGARALQASKTDTAMMALPLALQHAAPELRPRISLFLGYAELGHIAAMDQLAERGRDCAIAQRLDTLVTSASRHLEAGATLDSARVAPIVNTTLPQYRTRAAAMVSQYCRRRN